MNIQESISETAPFLAFGSALVLSAPERKERWSVAIKLHDSFPVFTALVSGQIVSVHSSYFFYLSLSGLEKRTLHFSLTYTLGGGGGG